MTGTAAVHSMRVCDARDLARELLGEHTDRWRHTAGVAARAWQLAAAVAPSDRDLLVTAAWLHDIGYAGQARDTGFHPLDGARFLDRHHAPARTSALVAHHSGACFLAAADGLTAALATYPDECSAVTDALAYADQTVGSRGQRLPIRERMADMLRRHGPTSPNAVAHRLRGPYLLAAAERVERRLASGRRSGSGRRSSLRERERLR